MGTQQITVRGVDAALWKRFRIECVECDVDQGEMLTRILRDRYEPKPDLQEVARRLNAELRTK